MFNHLGQETRITRTHDEDGSYSTIKLPETETRNALLGNLFISDGEPGKVLKIDCRERIGHPLLSLVTPITTLHL